MLDSRAIEWILPLHSIMRCSPVGIGMRAPAPIFRIGGHRRDAGQCRFDRLGTCSVTGLSFRPRKSGSLATMEDLNLQIAGTCPNNCLVIFAATSDGGARPLLGSGRFVAEIPGIGFFGERPEHLAIPVTLPGGSLWSSAAARQSPDWLY